jgi:hypothetical protein
MKLNNPNEVRDVENALSSHVKNELLLDHDVIIFKDENVIGFKVDDKQDSDNVIITFDEATESTLTDDIFELPVELEDWAIQVLKDESR